MPKIKVVLFDCMETIVDVAENPDIRLYAWWAYNGCGYESLWTSFDEFAHDYKEAKAVLIDNSPKYKEHDIIERFKYVVRKKGVKKEDEKVYIDAILKNFWKNYKGVCFVENSVKEALSELSSRFKCGVVSNFMVYNGIEDLLENNDISKYFDFIITSVKVGWQKPAFQIYDVALKMSGVDRNEILFVGDDYVCDYVGPSKFGFNAVLLDKKESNNKAERKIKKLKELTDL